MKSILLIEDDVVLRENTVELFELNNYKVIAVANGKIGVSAALKYFPDLIICDIMMPELDGYGVLQTLSKNKKTQHIPFIFLSAKTEHADVRRGMDMGADDYITKPFSEEELISAIKSRLAKAAILKDLRSKTPEPIQEESTEIKVFDDLIKVFEDNGQHFDVRKDEVIYREGNNSNYIYLVKKGLVKSYKLDEQGKELITALYKENDIFGFTSLTESVPYKETAETLKVTELTGISKTDLMSLLSDNYKVTLEFIQLLTENLSGLKEQLLHMAYGSVNKKTAATILQFAKKMNPSSEDPIKISRSDLASVAGIATETLIRTMTHFKKQGIIEIEGRNIKILDIKKLQSICWQV
ncbi:response regulator [Snuella lapsa]|uniref:Response regulator n=1 Tax=Snuella lapsa TaxID=870481 RepID=A0ABP6X664_9FLAO